MIEEQKYAKLQVEYGADGALKMTWVTLFLVGCLLIMSVISMALYNRIPQPKYFAVNKDNKFFSLPSLSEPSLSLSLLQNWVTTFTVAAHTFDFQNYESQLFGMKKFFTENAYRQYLEEMVFFSDSVKSNQLLLSCTILDAPSIQRSTVIDNRYEWYATIPILIRYDSASSAKTERRTLSLVIKRVDTNANPYGIAISVFRSS